MESEKYQHDTMHEMTKEELKRAIHNLKVGEVLSVDFPMPETESGRKRGRNAET